MAKFAFADQPEAKKLYRSSNPKSSKIAAKKAVKSGLVKSHEERILYWLKKNNGLTTKEIQHLSYLTPNFIHHTQAGKRTGALKDKGLIRVDETVLRNGCHPLYLVEK